jgi:hypothetical protein
MIHAKRLPAALPLLVALLLSACGGSAKTSIPASSRLEAVPGSTTGRIVLTPLGAERIGIQTGIVQRPRRLQLVVIPYSSLVYAPDGTTYAFISPSPLVYTEVRVQIDHIAGESVYLRQGPQPGARVVTVGAEELFGVQTGVIAQT